MMAGLLMFGKGLSIRERFDMIRLDYVDKSNLTQGQRYRDRLTYDGDWENNLFQFMTRVMPKLTRDVPVPFVLEGVQRVDDTPMHKLLREAMTNMIIHADFMLNGVLKVEKRDEGYLFTNPGSLKLPVEDIYRGGISAARNPHIQDLLRMIGYGDNLGTGFPEMVEIWENAWGGKPVLNERYELQLVELTFSGMKREIPSLENLPENLGELDRRIMAEIIANPTVTCDELAKALEKTRETIRVHLKSYERERSYHPCWSSQGGQWIVVASKPYAM